MVGEIYKSNFNADKVAVKFKGKAVTYQQLDDNVKAYASYLMDQGLEKGDKVVLNSINSDQFLYTYLGTTTAGAVIVPINPAFTMEEIKYVVQNSEAKFMVIHPMILQKAKLDKETIEKALGLKVLILDEKLHEDAMKAEKREFETNVDRDQISTYLYTSGTTGKPKAAMLSHHNLVLNSEQCCRALQSTEDEIYLCVLPMFHVFAFTACILLPLWSGATTVIQESFQPKEVISNLIGEDITVFMGVPAMYTVLLHASKNDVKFPNLKLAISGGAALPVEVYRQAKDIMKLPIIEGYGLTEASPGVSFNPRYGVQKEASIGLPIPGVEAIIADDDDNEVEAGVVGELLLRGENVMQGYFKQPEETEKALRNGWLHTGDLAKKDDEGYIFIVDRKKDMIVVAGMNVYSREVEEVIYQHPKVQEVAVIGVPDKTRGEAVKAYVVVKEGEHGSSKEILRFLKSKLAAYKIPRTIDFVDSLPKNSSGKILKRELKG